MRCLGAVLSHDTTVAALDVITNQDAQEAEEAELELLTVLIEPSLERESCNAAEQERKWKQYNGVSCSCSNQQGIILTPCGSRLTPTPLD